MALKQKCQYNIQDRQPDGANQHQGSPAKFIYQKHGGNSEYHVDCPDRNGFKQLPIEVSAYGFENGGCIIKNYIDTAKLLKYCKRYANHNCGSHRFFKYRTVALLFCTYQ